LIKRNSKYYEESDVLRCDNGVTGGSDKPPAGRKGAFDGRNGCQKCFCVTFDESNKAYAPYPALI
jgi:hypothetical protein